MQAYYLTRKAKICVGEYFNWIRWGMVWVDKCLASRHRRHHDAVGRNEIVLIQFLFFYSAGLHSSTA